MTVYLDMDGVIADFFGGIETKFEVDHWKSIQDKEIAFASLANTNFFNTLDRFDVSDDIVEFVKLISNNDWGICSSPMRGDTMNSAYWKRVWLNRMEYVPPLIENMIFTSNKHKYAINELTFKSNILIDDKPQNIERWERAGGIGIRYQANEDDFSEYLVPTLKEALRYVNR
jgi:5'(3')-deoxyribonucleotidase